MVIKKIFHSRKHVFWQAFFLTVLFFLLGVVFGVYMEQLRTENTNAAFYDSEASLYDSFALGQILQDSSISCEILEEAAIDFANKIYEEARELEKFDSANQLTDTMKIIHRKYDLLRTLLWMNVIDMKESCDMNTVVYLYIYDSQNIDLKSRQKVWSRILGELKGNEGNNFLLIPMAADQEISSLNYLAEKYGIEEFPAVIINEKDVFYDHETAEALEEYLN